MKCGNIRMTGAKDIAHGKSRAVDFRAWLSCMLKAYAIDLIVFSSVRNSFLRNKFFFGLQKEYFTWLREAWKICAAQNVSVRCLQKRQIKKFLRDYRKSGGENFEDCSVTKAFAMLMSAEGKFGAESVDIAKRMQYRSKEVAAEFYPGVAA